MDESDLPIERFCTGIENNLLSMLNEAGGYPGK